MSIEASSFVLGRSMGRGNGLRKLILLGHANHADKHGRDAYPSTRTIADYAECDVRTVQRHVGWLIERGYLREGDQRMVDHLDPRYRPIVYDVAMSPEQIRQWAETGPPDGTRTRAATAGRRGGRAASQLSRGDNLSPVTADASPQARRGDSLSPLESEPRGDSSVGSEVTDQAPRDDSGVTRTILEPSQEPSSSSPPETRPPVAGAATTGGPARSSMNDLLDVLPESVRDHPSVVPSAISRRARMLEERGWLRAQLRERLAGVEAANAPGAAALARLADLATTAAPDRPLQRPPWCGACHQRTRMREDANRDDRPYVCPDCHPRTFFIKRQR